jgi:MFS family permease
LQYPTPSTPIPLRLAAAIVVAHVAFSGNRFIFTLHAVALGATPLEIGLLLGLLMAGPMVLSVQFGRWSDRIGYQRLSVIGFTMLIAAGLAAAAAGGLPLLCVASVLTGCGYMLAHVAVYNAIGRVTPSSHTTSAFSLLATAFSLSALGGPLLSGIAIDQLGHRGAYLAMTVFAVASLLALWWATRRYSVPPVPDTARAKAHVFDLLQDNGLQAVFVASGLLSMAWDLFIFLAPLQGVRSGLSATATGAIVAAFSAGTFAIRLVLPAIARRLGEWRIMAATLFVTAAGFVAFPLMQGLGPLATAAFLLGMSLGCSQPVSMSLVYRTSPPQRAGEAVGIRATITAFSQTALPMLFGALGSAAGMVTVFWVASALLIAGGASAARRG